MNDLNGKHVVVVGGGSGIGEAIAAASASQGARVTISSRSEDKLNAAAARIGGGVSVAPVDMTDSVSVASWAEAVGEIDYLVISASSAAHGPFAEVEESAIRGMFDAKFFGPYAAAKAALPRIRDGGSITFFSGVLSRRPGVNCSGLGAVNAAVEGLTRGLALELGPKVRVNCCSPGMVRSDAYSGMNEEAREAMYEATGESLPVGRVGEVDEVAQSALFLLTNGYMTGQIVDIDGGHMIRQYATR